MPLLPELPRRFVYRWSVVSCMHRLHRQAQQPSKVAKAGFIEYILTMTTIRQSQWKWVMP